MQSLVNLLLSVHTTHNRQLNVSKPITISQFCNVPLLQIKIPASALTASNRPSNVFTEMIFLVESASLRSVSLLFLEDFVLGAAVVADKEGDEQDEKNEDK